jgi:hypothetical protein
MSPAERIEEAFRLTTLWLEQADEEELRQVREERKKEEALYYRPAQPRLAP